MSGKKMISKEVDNIEYNLEGSLSSAIEYLQDMLERYPGGVIVWDDRGYEDKWRLYLDDQRLETDFEFDQRVVREKLHEERMMALKKAQLERLKKELGEE